MEKNPEMPDIWGKMPGFFRTLFMNSVITSGNRVRFNEIVHQNTSYAPVVIRNIRKYPNAASRMAPESAFGRINYQYLSFIEKVAF